MFWRLQSTWKNSSKLNVLWRGLSNSNGKMWELHVHKRHSSQNFCSHHHSAASQDLGSGHIDSHWRVNGLICEHFTQCNQICRMPEMNLFLHHFHEDCQLLKDFFVQVNYLDIHMHIIKDTSLRFPILMPLLLPPNIFKVLTGYNWQQTLKNVNIFYQPVFLSHFNLGYLLASW